MGFSQSKKFLLTRTQMAELFERDKSTISRHIKNVYDEGELERSALAVYIGVVLERQRSTV